jgi:hypothetical protein
MILWCNKEGLFLAIYYVEYTHQALPDEIDMGSRLAMCHQIVLGGYFQ